MSDYEAFVDEKRHAGAAHGFDPVFMPDALFDFQRSLAEWSIRQGRAAILADCGLGKTPMQLVWAENVARHTGRPVLILSPLAVAAQTVREGEKFGIECKRSADGATKGARTVLTNYERLHLFTAADFSGVACDESSILKGFDGARRAEITSFMRKVPYRLLCTATAAPNDYLELGTSSEALGYLGHMDMLTRFFSNDSNTSHARRIYGEAPKWRLKGHSPTPFWRWVASWARACRKPSDLGFKDGPFVLPRLSEAHHLIKPDSAPPGMLFALPARSLEDQRAERKRTVRERCEKVASLVNDTGQPAVVWCHLNEEGDTLASLIPDAIQVSGKDDDDTKEDRFGAFSSGKARIMITKPKIGAWGLNWQHCAHVTYFTSHSYESYYQAVRRCWRFGQKRPVVVDVVYTEGERRVLDNLQRKAEAASAMFTSLVAEMNNAQAINVARPSTAGVEAPSWLTSQTT